ncbi:MAG: Hcp family type VI secretion system effector [Limisphaerales bacterium]
MAGDMFIKIGDISGEAQDKAHSKEIEVLSWSWGVTNAGDAHKGSGGGSGKASCQDLSITKYIDSASPKLALACCKGTHYDTVQLTVRKAGDKPLEYIKIKLTQVTIAGISTGTSGREDRLTENVGLNFAAITYDYVPQGKDGSAGTTITMSYDFSQNTSE